MKIRYSSWSVVSTIAIATLLSVGCSVAQPPSHVPSVINEEIKAKADELDLKSKARTYELVHHLNDLAWPIVSKNLDICGKHTMWASGLHLAIGAKYSDTERELIFRNNAMKFDGKPLVHHVVPDSPAEQTGIQAGDHIVAMGAHQLDAEEQRKFSLNAVTRMNDLVRKGEPFSISYLRNSQQTDVSLVPQRVCRHEISISDSAAINAYTDGNRIRFTRGIMEFGQSDLFLQAVFAHELAHGIYNHPTKTIPKAAVGLILDLAALSKGVWSGGRFTQVFSQFQNKDLEREADYVAYYLLANAGLEFEGAFAEWEDIAVRFKGGNSRSSTHPSSAERLVIGEKIAAEINEKISSGRPLVPNR